MYKFQSKEEEISFLRAYVKQLRRENGELQSLVDENQHYKNQHHQTPTLTKREKIQMRRTETYRMMKEHAKKLKLQIKNLKAGNEQLIIKNVALENEVIELKTWITNGK